MKISDVAEDIDRELVTRAQIDAKIEEVARQVSQDYAGRDVLLVGVLKGAVNTLVALSQAMSINAQMDFVSLSSYGSGTSSSGTVTMRQDLSTDVRGRNVLVVEDIIDSGLTLEWLVNELRRRGAASVEVFALFDKPARHKTELHPKYQGIVIPDEFVVGFGLDYAEKYRNLDSVAILKPSVYSKEAK
ncbi:MAG: hypoxanthine phosphoribosyltransferase [Bifidobacteriaceae bacterium]|nr:hypoxanthine phosphoribosyltransferase [Bifidobacteriaceae bacterium]